MLKTQTVYSFNQQITLYAVTDDVTKLTIWLSDCSEMQLTPKQLLDYTNIKYPEANIPIEGTQVAIMVVEDLCSGKKVGTGVNFFNLIPNFPCAEQKDPNFVGQAWRLDFVCGKQLLYGVGPGDAQFLRRYVPLIDPLTGINYTHIQMMYMYIIGSDGFDKQKTGFITTNTKFVFLSLTTAAAQCIYPLTLTN